MALVRAVIMAVRTSLSKFHFFEFQAKDNSHLQRYKLLYCNLNDLFCWKVGLLSVHRLTVKNFVESRKLNEE